MSSHAQTTRYVSLAGSGEAPYTSLATAATVIQDAVDAADPGDTILVAAGVYDQGGRKAPGMGLTNRVCITEPITLESLDGREVTEIRGQGPKGNSAVRCLFVTNGVTVTGFTLSGGSTATSSLQYLNDQGGGGVFCYYGGHLIDCKIIGCEADRRGGGVHCLNGGLLDRCTIFGNIVRGTQWGEGGGVMLEYAGILNDCIISSNTNRFTAFSVQPYGGGVFMAQGGELNRCVIRDNVAFGDYDNPHGGGVYIENSGDVNDCLIIGNTATAAHDTAYGGGVYFHAGGTVTGCTITGNSADKSGGGAFKYSSGHCNSSIVWGNSAPTDPNHANVSMTYSCTSPLPSSGFNNTNAAPAFTSDYRLTAMSPCVDSGDPTILSGVGQDGVPRPLDGDTNGTARIDMGACEFASAYADSDLDGQYDADEVALGTDPTDPTNLFGIAESGVDPVSGGIIISWNSMEGVLYDLYQAAALQIGMQPHPGHTNMPGIGSMMSITNMMEADIVFFSIHARIGSKE
jgi:hypothetical protein